jgi:uncharacterized protein
MRTPPPLPNMRTLSALILLLSFVGSGAFAQVGPDQGVLQARQQDFVVPRTQQYDFTSKVNGRKYRIMLAMPPGYEQEVRYPVIYVLDGNEYFATAADTVTRQSHFKVVRNAIVVGIGYPTDDLDVVDRERAFDFTPSLSTIPSVTGNFGGAAAFERVIEEEIKPFVQSKVSVDQSNQTLWGYSYGGLFALRTLLRNTGTFSTYVLSSPSIWWNNLEILEDESAFTKRAQTQKVNLRILITSGGDEQYKGSDKERLARPMNRARLVDNASELAARLSDINPSRVQVTRTIFEGENHGTASLASLSRAIRFALPRDAK